MGKKKAIIREFPYNKIGSYRRMDPYSIVFVYPRIGQNYILKGSIIAIKEFIDEKLTPCIAYYQFYHHGESRGYANVHLPDRPVKAHNNLRVSAYLSSHAKTDDNLDFHRKHWKLSVYARDVTCHGCLFKKRYRRPPRGWIKELDQFL